MSVQPYIYVYSISEPRRLQPETAGGTATATERAPATESTPATERAPATRQPKSITAMGRCVRRWKYFDESLIQNHPFLRKYDQKISPGGALSDYLDHKYTVVTCARPGDQLFTRLICEFIILMGPKRGTYCCTRPPWQVYMSLRRPPWQVYMSMYFVGMHLRPRRNGPPV